MTMPRRILIATPLKGEIPPEYFKLLFDTLHSRIPECAFGYTFIGGTSIQWARDEAAFYASKYDEILWLDKDLTPTPAQVARLCSFNEDVVCSMYPKRDPKTVWHVTGMQGEEPRADGLMRVTQSAIGFSKIKTSVFAKLREESPERAYTLANGGEEPRRMHELFPMGIVGKNTAAGKLKRIREAIESSPTVSAQDNRLISYDLIASIMNDSDYSDNQMLGEDYYFCRLCREAGIPIYVDTQSIIPHTGEIQFPIATELLAEMMAEEWRKES